MKLIKVSTVKQYLKIYGLYHYSFPVREKKPFISMVKRNKNGKMDMWYIEEKGNFIGLAITMKWKDMILLDYFAIYGTIDIETPDGGGICESSKRVLRFRDGLFCLGGSFTA